ncbi:MAG: DUF3696 domain-containing protein [Acidimicrobiia bacterium]
MISNLIPTRQSVGRPLKEITGLRAGMRMESPNGFFFSGLEALRIPAAWRQDQERWSKALVWFNAAYQMQDVYSAINRAVTRRLRLIAYLGPLRSLPQRTYRTSPERPSDVGREGQFAPELLYRTANSEVKEAVDAWLRKLGYGTLVFEDRGDDFFQVFLRTQGQHGLKVNIAHCGVGLSQLLPILVQGFTAPEDTTFIVQQPEIHLNPAQQALVTDFLIDSTTDNGRRIVVETHSEHILLRLRRRLAEGQITSDEVAVYFCDNVNGQTVLEQIDVDDAGRIDRADWPKGFFEDQLADSLELARAQSRQVKQQQ